MNLRAQTLRGIGWTTAARLIRVLLLFVISAILARLLTPNDFGLLAMVTVFSNFIFVFGDFGFSTALVQKKELSDGLLSSVFWIGLGLGALLTISLAACAPLIAAFYSEQRLIPIVVVLSSTLFFQSCGNVQKALLTKRMDFKALAIISVSALGTSGAIGIFLAFAGFGVWSLVWYTVLGTIATSALYWIFSRWVPHLSFSLQRVREVARFGANLTGYEFVNYVSRNTDNLLIGRVLGPSALGFYNLAYNSVILPVASVCDIVGQVMFPALSHIHDDKRAARDACIVASRFVAFVIFPMMTLLLVAAPQFVVAVYGQQWLSAIPLVQILALVAIVQSIENVDWWIYFSQARTDIMFRWGIVTTTAYVISFVVGVRSGVIGVAIAYAIAVFLLAYPSFAIPFKLIDLKIKDFFAPLTSVTLATLASGIVGFSVRFFFEELAGVPNVIVLVVVVVTGLASYLGLLFVLDRNLFTTAFHLISEFLHPPISPTEDQVD